MKKPKSNVYNFYNEDGWTESKKFTKDAILFEDLRDVAQEYVKYCRNRINKYLATKGDHLLDFASGPIQYDEYLNYSKNFKLRHCVDFSKQAIDKAREKIGSDGRFYCDDFSNINFENNYFDTIISLHTIYHIPKDKQAEIINKFIKISKKNSPIIIVYSNPNTITNLIKRIIFYKKNKKKDDLYFYCHPLKWWLQFSNLAKVEFFPWRSFSSQHQKVIFPNNKFGKYLFKILIKLEEMFPNFFVKNFQYPLIVLKKY